MVGLGNDLLVKKVGGRVDVKREMRSLRLEGL